MLVNLDYVLKKAQEGKYQVGLFNTTDSDMLQAAIETAEELNSPIIVGTAEILLPYGELKLIAPSIIDYAKRASVPVVVHYDHGLTFERCMEALKLGFTSVMFDGSTKSYEDNIKETREVVKIAHAFGATVEGEIGHVGMAMNDDNMATDMYTTPTEAKEYLEATGVDALAVAIGSAHGVYKTRPKLSIERLKEISDVVDVPLVLHGGSGISDEDFRKCAQYGMSKINVFTDLCLAGDQAMKEGLEKNLGYLETRNLKVKYMKEVVRSKMLVFGSQNKA